MFRPLAAACLMVALLVTAGALPLPASAQSSRAYAPEDLRRLPLPDQVRVIEREYADQSRGRTIPDDQLEFYLDQIESDWGFSRIRQDIASSLRGGGGSRPGDWNGSNWSGQTLICSSTDRRRRECDTPFSGRPALVENISGTRCVEGVNFGGGNGVMWVDQGCRGRFTQGRGGWAGSGSGQRLRCESQDRRERVCPTGFRGQAMLVRQLSGSDCVEGRTWGQRGGSVWVSNGCRAEFAERRGGGGWAGGRGGADPGYSVTCNSEGNRQRSCAWDRRQGRPVLVENLSSTRCEEGYNWGFDGNAIRVDHGCRARFGTR